MSGDGIGSGGEDDYSKSEIVYLQSVNLGELHKDKKVCIDKQDDLPFAVEETESRIYNFDQMLEICKTEYNVYLNHKNSGKYKNFNYRPTFGFLLKERRNKSENIIIYTNLYDYIKKILYVSSFNKNISKHNNINLTILSVYLFDLKTMKNYNIVQLFPQYKKMFTFIKRFIFEKLPMIIILYLKK
jgi:hypothetical protein